MTALQIQLVSTSADGCLRMKIHVSECALTFCLLLSLFLFVSQLLSLARMSDWLLYASAHTFL